MKTESYTISYTVDQSPQEVFDAINKFVGGGRERLPVPPTNSVPSLPTDIRTCTAPLRGSPSWCQARKSSGASSTATSIL